MRKVDVAIIGAGSAGLSARREVAKVTDNYVVIDDGPMGTTCARVGCMPSKVLIEAANMYHRRHKFAEVGIKGHEQLSMDRSEAMKHVRKLRDRFVRGVLSGIESWRSTHLIAKRATFIDQNTLDLGDEKIFAKSIIIATGSTPIFPKPWQKYKKYFMDTNQFFETEELPQTMAVIGLGVIGIELGQALNRLGVDVKGITIGKAIGGLSSPKLQDYVLKTFRDEMTIETNGADIVGEENNQLVIKSGEKTFKVDKALLSLGRAPAIAGLGLDKINIELNERGLPIYDKNTMLIPGTNIYFTGDANADRPLLHEASDEGRIAGYNAVREKKQCFRRREFLAITFSDPNIAVLGKSHQQLIDENANFVTGEVSHEGFGRAIVKLKEKGLIQIYADKASGELLGAEMFGPGVEHMAHSVSWLIHLGLTLRDALSLPFYHPVMEESLRTAFRNAAEKIDDKSTALEVLRCQDPPAGLNCN